MKLGRVFSLVVLAAALASFGIVKTASATILTGAGGTTLGVGTTFEAESEGTVTLHPPIGDLECEKVWWTIDEENAGGSSATVALLITKHTWNCWFTFHTIEFGTLEIHTNTTSPNNNGEVHLAKAQWTVEAFGFHCIFSTSNTDIGTLTGSATTGGNATLDISATIPRTGGRSGAFCGTTAQWTGSFKFTNPSVLNVD